MRLAEESSTDWVVEEDWPNVREGCLATLGQFAGDIVLAASSTTSPATVSIVAAAAASTDVATAAATSAVIGLNLLLGLRLGLILWSIIRSNKGLGLLRCLALENIWIFLGENEIGPSQKKVEDSFIVSVMQ